MTRILCLFAALFITHLHATTLLVYGDSLSAGYQLTAEQSWPALLQKQWQAEKRDLKLVNASISGETTQGGLERLPQTLKHHKPGAVLIELGANDGLRGLPPELTRQNLQQMVIQIRQADAKPLLMQIRLPRNYGQRYIAQFETIYPELARQEQIPLLPFLLEPLVGQAELFLPDGIHPNALGQQQLVKQLAPLLTSELLSLQKNTKNSEPQHLAKQPLARQP